MRNLCKNIISTLIIGSVLLMGCVEEEVTTPETIPVKAEIKQFVINNALSKVAYKNVVPDDADTVVVTVPKGTDLTQMDVDITYSYFGSIEPEPGIVDLTNPITYTVTSNVEERVHVVEANVVDPVLTSFILTSPVEAVAKIENNTIFLEVKDGTDLSSAEFMAEYFGASINPEETKTIDITDKNQTLKVVNEGFETVYNFDVYYIGRIYFEGVIWDATQTPNDFLDGSVDTENQDGWAVEADASAYKGSVVHFTSLDDDNGQANFDYANLGLTAEPDQVTTILKIKGIDDSGEHYAEMQFVIADLRAKLVVRNDRLEVIGSNKVSVKSDAWADINYDPLNWNVYRVTINKVTTEVKVYLNEDPNPVLEEFLYGGDGNTHKFGDGGGKLYECLFDYIAIDTEGAYSPEDLALEDILDTE